jgi:hypothetical protein
MEVGVERPSLGKMYMVAGAFGTQGQQVFIEARRLGQIASELGDTRPLQVHCRLGLRTLYVEAGQRERSRAELSVPLDL